MPTLQCTSCGATYHTAATGPHLALAPLMFGCRSCGSGEPLHIGVASSSGTEVAEPPTAREALPERPLHRALTDVDTGTA
jgi:hypothetical protein